MTRELDRSKFPDLVNGIYINKTKFYARQYPAPDSDCIYMTGAKHSQNYPMIPGWKDSTKKYGMHTAHRIAWSLANGKDIPAGMQVIHTCLDMACVSPKHLFLGTSRERGEHMKEMGHTTLGISQRRECKKQANRRYRYTDDEIRMVRNAPIEDVMKYFGWDRTKALRKRYSFTHEAYQWLRD